jgi:NAD dependent epimerase/dehydratase family enzyme
MNILIAGATGMIDTALVKALKKDHTLVLLGRDTIKLKQRFPDHTAIDWQAFSAPVSETAIALQ